jgi:polysaccharide export outer membrane protein
MSRRCAILLVLAVSWALGAFSLWAQEPANARSYRIGPRDRIQIRVEELPGLDSEQEVADDGTINLGVVGNIDAQGATESELETRIRTRLLSEGLRKATVTVVVSEFRSRPVSIIGAVGNPGNHFVPGRTTLLEVLLAAGGLDADHGPNIQVRRRADNGLSDQVEIPVRSLIELGDPQVNIPVFAGDLINVPPAREIVIHFLGEVQNVGSQTFTSNKKVTLLTAIARAGGLTETASSKISIKRQTESGEREEIVVDFRRLLSGRDPDIELQDGDLVVVKESFF